MDQREVREQFQVEQNRYVSELTEFLAFESVSTDPAYHEKCLQCVDWLTGHLKGIGFSAEILQTGGKPVVYAEYSPQSFDRTILFYGHYDVQPVDPIEEWTSPPFQAQLRDGRLYARGAQDNKGQLFYVLKALEFLVSKNQLAHKVKILIEGEEECGSKSLTEALSSWRERLAADVLMVCDTGTPVKELNTITMGLRGIVGLTVTLSGPRTDLHSGVHGGVAPNPALEIAHLLSKLHDANGAIAIPGYYDDVPQYSPAEIQAANAFTLTSEQYQAMSGVVPVAGEQNRSFSERRGMRPTIEINGVHSGYGGAGMKTIIPARAFAKISSRLVAGQNPAVCLTRLEEFLKKNAPTGLLLEVSDQDQGGPGVRVPLDSPVIQSAREILKQVGTGQVALIWEGASIPIVSSLVEASGAQPLLVGFGLEEDNIHAPNESFALEQFEKGFLYAALFLSQKF